MVDKLPHILIAVYMIADYGKFQIGQGPEIERQLAPINIAGTTDQNRNTSTQVFFKSSTYLIPDKII